MIMLQNFKRLLVTLFTMLIFSLVFINVLLYLRTPQLVFQPSKLIEQTPTHWGLNYETVNILTDDGVKLRGWYFPVQSSDKVILFMHGNAGNMSHREQSLKVFHQLRLNVLLFDYRGFGKSEGIPSEQGLYEDARAAWRYLTEVRHVKPHNIIIFGRSLGGSVAAKLSSEVNAAGLILESTFSSLRDIVREAFPVFSVLVYLRYRFDTVAAVRKISYPVLVIHSRDDEIIPYSLGQKVFAAVPDKKQFVTIHGDHNYGFVQSLPQYTQALRSWLSAVFPLIVQPDLQARDAGV